MSDLYKYYIIYRMFPDGKGKAYGWTFDKKILKSFLKQRSAKKYKAITSTYDEITSLFSEQVDGAALYGIDWLELTSNRTGETVKLFLTENEKIVAEKAIKRLLKDTCALDRINGEIEDYVDMVRWLKEKYFDALDLIGYHPKELEALFDSIEDYSSMTTAFNRETGAYYEITPDEFYQMHNVSSGDAYDHAFNQIIWSLESFIRVMKEEL